MDEPIRLDKLISDGDDDRWNGPGEPTVYLALEPAVVLAELARHLEVNPASEPVRRRLLGLTIEVEGLLDLRQPETRRAIGAPEAIEAFRDRAVAREVARRARTDFGARGLVVPSMAFLDQPSRGNLVLFMELFGGLSRPSSGIGPRAASSRCAPQPSRAGELGTGLHGVTRGARGRPLAEEARGPRGRLRASPDRSGMSATYRRARRPCRRATAGWPRLPS